MFPFRLKKEKEKKVGSPTVGGVNKEKPYMTPETKKAATATYAATKEFILATTDLMVAFFHLSVKTSVLTYNLGVELRYAVDNFIEEQERKARKLLNPAADVGTAQVTETVIAVSATRVDDESTDVAEAASEEETANPEPEIDLEELTVRQLTELSAELGIKFSKRPKKAELIEAIKDHRQETQVEHQKEPVKTIQIQTGRIETQTHLDTLKTTAGIQGQNKRELGSYLAELIVA